MADSETLYHYTTLEAFISIVKCRTIRLSALTQSNDSTEGQCAMLTLERLARKANLEEPVAQWLLSSTGAVMHRVEALGFCLSKDGDLLSQWRGYAGGATGVSIGFDVSWLRKLEVASATARPQGHPPKLSLLEVQYTEADQDRAFGPIMEKFLAALSHQGRLPPPYGKSGDRDLLRDARSEFYQRKFELKKSAFREEQEWRLLSTVGFTSYTNEFVQYRAAGSRLIPYADYGMDLVPGPAIKRVMLGPKNETPRELVEALLKRYGHPNVSVELADAGFQ